LIDYYTGKEVLHEVDGTKEMEAVFGDIVSILGE
jgi:adenylate kinase